MVNLPGAISPYATGLHADVGGVKNRNLQRKDPTVFTTVVVIRLCRLKGTEK